MKRLAVRHRVWNIAGALEFRVCQSIRLPAVAHRRKGAPATPASWYRLHRVLTFAFE
jgi:hypothetical protein